MKLGEDNPNIVDLSDVNRPDCLAEKFSQLYDDKWTNAFELIKESKGYDEDKEAIKLLLDILMVRLKQKKNIYINRQIDKYMRSLVEKKTHTKTNIY